MAVNFMLIATNVIIIFLEYKRRSVSILLWGVLFVLFTVPHLVHYHFRLYPNYIMDEAGLIAVMFNLTYIISRATLNREKQIVTFDLGALREEPKTRINLYYLLFIGSFIIYVYEIVSEGYSLLYYTWSDAAYGRSFSFFESVARFLLQGLAGVGFIAYARKEKANFGLLSIVYIAYVAISRSRYNVIPFLLPFLLSHAFAGRIKQRLRAFAGGILIIFIVFALQQVRYMGSFSDLVTTQVSITEIVGNTLGFIREGKGEFGLSKAYYFFVENANAFNRFGQGRTYRRLLLWPIPSSWISIKPRDFAMDMYEAWTGRATQVGTMHPTLYGDVYANFGVMGFLGGVFYALLISFFDRLLVNAKTESKKILYISISGTMYVLLARGAVYNSIVNAFWSMILVNILLFIQSANKRIP